VSPDRSPIILAFIEAGTFGRSRVGPADSQCIPWLDSIVTPHSILANRIRSDRLGRPFFKSYESTRVAQL
jgi:hypothetical protein